MLFLGVAPLPLFYHDILRYVVTIVFIWAVLFLNLEKEDSKLALFFGIGAILFNPIFVIELPKLIWFFIDIGFGAFLLFNFKNLQRHNNGIDAKDDNSHVKEKFKYSNRDKYEGEYKNGEFHGQGTFTSTRGIKYEGTWKYGLRHGQGTQTSPDGDKCVGEFKDNIIWNGTEYVKNGNLKVKYVNGEKKE